MTTLGESMVWVPSGRQDSGPTGKLSLSLFWGQQQSPCWRLHQGPRVWQWRGPGQSDPVTRSRLRPRCSAFLDSCSFSELSFLAFHSDTVSMLFCSELISLCLFAWIQECWPLQTWNVYYSQSTESVALQSRPSVPCTYCYNYLNGILLYLAFQDFIFMLHLFRCPWCVIFCWSTDLYWEEDTLDYSLFDFFIMGNICHL